MALVVVFGLAACADDDTPKLSGVQSGALTLDAGSIDGNNSKYTFTWTSTSFYLDGDMQRKVSLVGYEKNGIDYHLMGVQTGRDMSEAVDFGAIVSANHMTLDYESIAKVMISDFGMVRKPDEEQNSSIDFQLVAHYSNPDSCQVKSDIITVPFVLTVTPPVTGAVAGPDGNQYYEIPLTDSFYSGTVHLIIHDEVNDGDHRVESQSVLAVAFGDETEDVYLRVTGDELDGYDVVRVEKPLPRLYVNSKLGWSAYAMYVWPEDDELPGWPGIQPIGTENIGGENWLVFEPTKPYTKKATNWIINNNGAGEQYDLMSGFNFTQNTFVRVAADGSYTVANGPIASEGYVVYIIDQTGWDEITCYQWGDVNDFGGGWPGKAVDGTVTFGGNTYKYFNYGADAKGLNQNLIFNNGGNGVQLGDFNFTFERDLYLTVTDSSVKEN